MVNRSKIKGTSWESEGVRVLREEGATGAERRAPRARVARAEDRFAPVVVWSAREPWAV